MFELPNPKSFWGTVFSYSYGDNDFYTVEDNEGVLHQCCLECLRLRVNFSIVVGTLKLIEFYRIQEFLKIIYYFLCGDYLS